MKYKSGDPLYLNIAAICPGTRALGPGLRYVIWVQGCCFDCKDCASPEWREQKIAHLITTEALATDILHRDEIEGITISGGEPFLQTEALCKLLELVKREKDLSIVCFTGFKLNELRENQSSDKFVISFLNFIDVLIDGHYVPLKNDDMGLRGSYNQTVHFLTPRLVEFKDDFLYRKRSVEIHPLPNGLLMSGIPPKGFRQVFHRIADIVEGKILNNIGKPE